MISFKKLWLLISTEEVWIIRIKQVRLSAFITRLCFGSRGQLKSIIYEILKHPFKIFFLCWDKRKGRPLFVGFPGPFYVVNIGQCSFHGLCPFGLYWRGTAPHLSPLKVQEYWNIKYDIRTYDSFVIKKIHGLAM